ncbi:MAG: ribose 5-phosphate isomerase B [Chloroflexota bacterium]|nr:ribose 5-phosphate isomerase B [Chloroflexota bacterium]
MKADENYIRQMVRRVVYRTLGLPQVSRPAAARPLVTEADVQAVPVGGRIDVPQGALVTPLARQAALERRVTMVEASPQVDAPSANPSPMGQQTIAIGADHGGYELKEMLKGYLGELGYRVVDCGTDSTSSVDYPDFAFAVAQLVAQGRTWRGIVVDGAGIGSCMAANKVPGVRAGLCYDQATASNSREHNDANVLTLGAGMIGPNLAQQIVKTWLETPFGGGRHARRVHKIMEIEGRFLKRET